MARIEEFYQHKREDPVRIYEQPRSHKVHQTHHKKGDRRLFLLIVTVVLLVASLAGNYYLYNKNKNAVSCPIAETAPVAQSSPAGAETPADNTAPATDQSAPQTEENQAQSVAPASKVKVAVYNGTKIAGLAKTLADKIAQMENMEILTTTNAKGIYNKNIVVDLSGSNSAAAQQIAQQIGGETGEMPTNEKKPEADILVIGGKK